MNSKDGGELGGIPGEEFLAYQDLSTIIKTPQGIDVFKGPGDKWHELLPGNKRGERVADGACMGFCSEKNLQHTCNKGSGCRNAENVRLATKDHIGSALQNDSGSG